MTQPWRRLKPQEDSRIRGHRNLLTRPSLRSSSRRKLLRGRLRQQGMMDRYGYMYGVNDRVVGVWVVVGRGGYYYYQEATCQVCLSGVCWMGRGCEHLTWLSCMDPKWYALWSYLDKLIPARTQSCHSLETQHPSCASSDLQPESSPRSSDQHPNCQSSLIQVQSCRNSEEQYPSCPSSPKQLTSNTSSHIQPGSSPSSVDQHPGCYTSSNTHLKRCPFSNAQQPSWHSSHIQPQGRPRLPNSSLIESFSPIQTLPAHAGPCLTKLPLPPVVNRSEIAPPGGRYPSHAESLPIPPDSTQEQVSLRARVWGNQPGHFPQSIPTSRTNLGHEVSVISKCPSVAHNIGFPHRSGSDIPIEESDQGTAVLLVTCATKNMTYSCIGESQIDCSCHVHNSAVYNNHCRDRDDCMTDSPLTIYTMYHTTDTRGMVQEPSDISMDILTKCGLVTTLESSPLLLSANLRLVEGSQNVSPIPTLSPIPWGMSGEPLPLMNPSVNISSGSITSLGSFPQDATERGYSAPQSVYRPSTVSIPSPLFPSLCISSQRLIFTYKPASPLPQSTSCCCCWCPLVSASSSLICDHVIKQQFIYTPWGYTGHQELPLEATRGRPGLPRWLERECWDTSLLSVSMETNRQGVQASNRWIGEGLGNQTSSICGLDGGLEFQINSWGTSWDLDILNCSWEFYWGLGFWIDTCSSDWGLGHGILGDIWCWPFFQDMTSTAESPTKDTMSYSSELSQSERCLHIYSCIHHVEYEECSRTTGLKNPSQATESKAMNCDPSQASVLTTCMDYCLGIHHVSCGSNGDNVTSTSERAPCHLPPERSGPSMSLHPDPSLDAGLVPADTLRLGQSQTLSTQQQQQSQWLSTVSYQCEDSTRGLPTVLVTQNSSQTSQAQQEESLKGDIHLYQNFPLSALSFLALAKFTLKGVSINGFSHRKPVVPTRLSPAPSQEGRIHVVCPISEGQGTLCTTITPAMWASHGASIHGLSYSKPTLSSELSQEGRIDMVCPPHVGTCSKSNTNLMSPKAPPIRNSVGCNSRTSFLGQILLVAILMVSGGPMCPVLPVAADEIVIKLGPPVPKLNAFVQVGFDPTPLEVIKGVTVTEVVNVSVTDPELAQKMEGRLWVWPCCPDTRVANVVEPRPVELSSGGNLSTLLPLTIRGVGLGRTSIRFLVYKNATYQANDKNDMNLQRKDSDDISPSSALLLSPGPITNGKFPGDLANLATLTWNHSGATWMLLEAYEVKVVKGEGEVAAFYLRMIVLVLTAVNMVGIGGQVDGELMMHLLKNPVAISLNMVCRFGIIPAVALGIVELLTPNMDSGLGVLVLLTAPAEGTSNLLVLLAEADLTLSVTITCVTNFAAIGMLPLWTILFETQIYHTPGNVEIPFRHAFILFGYMVIALTAGFIFHRKFPIKYHHFWTYLPSLTIFTIIFCIIVEIHNAHYVFIFITKEIFLASMLLAVCCASFGAIVAFVFQQPNEKILILTLESATRTTYFTFTLLIMSLKEPDSDIAKTTSLVVTLLTLIPSFILVCLYRVYKRYTGKDFTDPIYAPTSSYSEEEIVEEEVVDVEVDEEGREIEQPQNGTSEKTEKCLPVVEVVNEKETCI